MSRRIALLALLVPLAAWVAAPGRAAASAFRLLPEQVYTERASGPLRADVRIPRGSGPFPAVLLLHPGSWRRGSKALTRRLAEKLAGRGFVAISIDYRLTPEHRFPSQVEDARSAVRWARRNARWLRVDPGRIGVFGYSAGGHLAALLATTRPDDDPGGVSSDVQAAVVGGGPSDLAELDDLEPVQSLLGGSSDQVPERYDRASPIRFASADDPPIFVYHGRSDWLIDVAHSRELAAALRRAGARVEYREAPGGHVSTWLFESEAEREGVRFLERWLGPPRVAAETAPEGSS